MVSLSTYYKAEIQNDEKDEWGPSGNEYLRLILLVKPHYSLLFKYENNKNNKIDIEKKNQRPLQ